MNGKVARSIGDRILSLRKILFMTQMDFAEKIGVNVSAIRRFENDTSFPAVESLIAIHQATQCNLHWLITGEGVMLLDIHNEPSVQEYNLKQDDQDAKKSDDIKNHKRLAELSSLLNDLDKIQDGQSDLFITQFKFDLLERMRYQKMQENISKIERTITAILTLLPQEKLN